MACPDVDVVLSDIARTYLRLHLTTDIGPIRLRRLKEHFGTLDAVSEASLTQLERVKSVGRQVAESIFRSRSNGAVDEEVARAAKLGLRIICLEDDEYPRPLLHTPDPPPCLYMRGRWEPTDSVAIAIVGTRRCSQYGREQALRFGEMLGAAGFTIVSGLARGVDGYAHRGALQGGGRTVAVLGCGLSSIYPAEHATLADEIAGAGAIVTEMPIEVGPEAKNFPKRNRIIAGLSLGVIIIEAGKKSGALITARLANEYNREVFALPGRVDHPQHTAGTHALIRDGGAKLITCLADVLDELQDVGEIMRRETDGSTGDADVGCTQHGAPIPKLSPQEQSVWDAITAGAEDTDAIVSGTPLETAQVMASLTSLQIKGILRQLPNGKFTRRG
ncbi:MAG: DNA-protecting protein DprA [Planctomycetes bacterium]|nr:DNA-protecting protein DprA [Planctomycetota bacterium]